MLLEVVPLAGDVAGDLHAVGEPDAGDLAKRGVRLLRGDRVDAGTDAAPLRCGDAAFAPLAGLEAGRRDLLGRAVPALPDELTGRRHGGEWYKAPREAHWEIAAPDQYAGERPLAWVDDSIDDTCREWADGRPAPTLLVVTESEVGLTDEHVDTLLEWARAGYTA